MLKTAIDEQHQVCTDNLKRMEDMARQAIQDIEQQKSLLEATDAAEQRLMKVETMLEEAEATLRDFKSLESFSRRQERVVSSARGVPGRSASMPAIIRNAMQVAVDRVSLLHAERSQPGLHVYNAPVVSERVGRTMSVGPHGVLGGS